MMHQRKTFVNVIPSCYNIVTCIVFLSSITCTALYGQSVSNVAATSNGAFPQFVKDVAKAKPSFKNVVVPSDPPIYLPLRPNASLISLQGLYGKDKSMIRRQADGRTDLDPSGPCRSFVMDVAVRNEFEFYSPGHSPNQPYPSQMDCVKTITAPPGHLLRLDFRDDFHLEQSEDCRFDYLEIRDGAHGYSNLIGSYCGNKHPPPITSSDRYLWLRFASDENIQYSGFHAVYWYIPRPTNSDQHPEMDMCRIEVSGNEGFANRSDINENRIRFSTTYGLPLDCMWIISVEQGWKIMLQFLKFRLEKPNDCESNFVDVFSDRTDLPNRLKNFCGSIADSVISKSNILHLRFFAEARSINSTFEALFTAFRDKPRDEACEEDEYDCEDATCISIDLRCNGRINCRFRWDEDECQPKLGAFAVILESEHIIIILVVFCLILSGMCFAFLFNCTKKLLRDHRIIQEHMRQSKEQENSIGGSKSKLSATDSILPKTSALSNHMASNSEDSSADSFTRESVKWSPLEERTIEDEEGHQVSGGPGDIIPVLNGKKKNAEPRRGRPREENLELSSLPEMRDSECQTRESLFSTHSIESTPTRSFIPSLADQRIHPKPPNSLTPGSFSRIPPFSTFGYTKTNEEGRSRPEEDENLKMLGFPRFSDAAHRTGNGKRYKAEAVIEVEGKKDEDALNADSGARPFSIDSTKSAPDVIVTH